jgi:hypothetical protein
MRFQLTASLLAADDAESTERASEGLEASENMLIKNYELYVGREGIPPIWVMDDTNVSAQR